MTRTFCLAFVLATSTLVQPVFAQAPDTDIQTPFTGLRSTELDVHGGLALNHLGVAVGARLNVPLLDNGFIASLNNAIYLTFGGDLYLTGSYYRDDIGVGVGLPITGRWQFNFNDRWSAYAEVGANIYLHSDWFEFGVPGNAALDWYIAALGGKYHFNPDMSLTLRLGAPYAAVGLDFRM